MAVTCGPEDELGGAVVAGADVADVGLPPHQHLGRAKVAQLQLVRRRVDLSGPAHRGSGAGVEVHFGPLIDFPN